MVSAMDRARGCDDRHTDSASGSIEPSQHPFSHCTIIFTTRMLLVYLVSTLYHCWRRPIRNPSPSNRSFSDFLINRGNVHAIGLGSITRRGGLAMLGVVWALALFGVIMKATEATASSETCDDSLPGTGWIGLTLIRPLALAIPLSACSV